MEKSQVISRDRDSVAVHFRLFDRTTASAIMIAGIIGSAIIAGTLPAALGKTNFVFYLAALVFFGLPFLLLPIVKKNCLSEAVFLFTDEGLCLQSKRKKKAVAWDRLSGYTLTRTRLFFGDALTLSLNYKEGKGFRAVMATKDDHLFIDAFLDKVSRYNHKVQNYEDKVLCRRPFLITGWGTALTTASVFFVMMAIQLVPRQVNRRNSIAGMALISLVIIIVVIGQRKKDKRFYELMMKKLLD